MANVNDLDYTSKIGIMTPHETYEEQNQRLRRIEELYYELLYAVGMKYPDESRHQTALRYIKEAEQQDNNSTAKELK